MDLKGIGGLLLGFGLISTVLYFLDMNLSILMWIDMWGDGVGWAIRGGMILAGGAIFALAPASEDSE